MEADVLDTAGLRGAEVREEIAGRVAAITARRMMVVRSMVNGRICVRSVGLPLKVGLVLVMRLTE